MRIELLSRMATDDLVVPVQFTVENVYSLLDNGDRLPSMEYKWEWQSPPFYTREHGYKMMLVVGAMNTRPDGEPVQNLCISACDPATWEA